MAAFLFSAAMHLAGVTNYSLGYVQLTNRYGDVLFWGLVGCAIVMICEGLRLKASVLLSCILIGVVTSQRTPASTTTAPAIEHGLWVVKNITPHLGLGDYRGIVSIGGIQTVFVLFIMSSYGSLSKIVNLTKDTTIQATQGAIPRLRKLLLIDGIAGALSGIMGTSSATTFVESGIGIAEGSRTGLSSIVVGILMLAALWLEPLVRLISNASIVGALMFVGVLLIPKKNLITGFCHAERVTVAVMLLITCFTLSLSAAFAVGIIGFYIARVIARRSTNTLLPSSAQGGGSEGT